MRQRTRRTRSVTKISAHLVLAGAGHSAALHCVLVCACVFQQRCVCVGLHRADIAVRSCHRDRHHHGARARCQAGADAAVPDVSWRRHCGIHASQVGLSAAAAAAISLGTAHCICHPPCTGQ